MYAIECAPVLNGHNREFRKSGESGCFKKNRELVPNIAPKPTSTMNFKLLPQRNKLLLMKFLPLLGHLACFLCSLLTSRKELPCPSKQLFSCQTCSNRKNDITVRDTYYKQ